MTDVGITGRWEYPDQTLLRLDALVAKVDEATQAIAGEVLKTVQRQQRTLLALGTHPYGTPTGSPPGSPPWRISGSLASLVLVSRLTRVGDHTWEGEVGPTSVYGRIQELGGWAGRRHRSYLPPRPSLYPAWRIVAPTARTVAAKRWQEATTR